MLKKKEITDQTVITKVEKMESGEAKNAFILFLSGPLVGKLHQLNEGETVLGRAPGDDIVINDNRISRKHISVSVAKGKAVLKDLNSTNGTYVNGKRVETHTLKDGDKIQLSSNTIFKFAHQDNLENIFHKELYKMAVLDAVTGIFNKRYFLERLNEEFSHARRKEAPLSLMMIDVDHFKAVNDTHGHLAGDFALAHLAKIIKKMVRTEDIVARYGGEEFGIILRGTDVKGAYLLAERIRKTVEKTPLEFEKKTIAMTISIGVASHLEEKEVKTPEALIASADHYLYQSKTAGRNQTSPKRPS